MNVSAILNRLRELAEASVVLQRIANDVESLLLRPPPPLPSPFVCVFVEGTRDDGSRITFGQAKELEPGSGTTSFELQALVRVNHARLTVFADMRRVAINGMFNGVDLMTADLGECPVGYANEVMPGIKLRVQCTRRMP